MRKICLLGGVDKRAIAYPLIKVLMFMGKTLVVADDGVYRRFSDDYALRFNYQNSDFIISPLIDEGILEEGAEYHDVSQLVTSAKRKYALEMKEFILQYLERLSISLRNVKGLLVVGGGSKPTIRTLDESYEQVSPAMSEILSDYLVSIAPKLEVVSTEGKDLRHLNIDGLTYMYKYQD